MKKRLSVQVFIFLLASLWATGVSAEVTKAPNLVGKWSGPETVSHNSGFITDRTMIVRITVQSGSAFRGFINAGGGNSEHPVNGVIMGEEIKITGGPAVMSAKLTFYPALQIQGTFQELENADDPLSPCTGIFTLKKISNTP